MDNFNENQPQQSVQPEQPVGYDPKNCSGNSPAAQQPQQPQYQQPQYQQPATPFQPQQPVSYPYGYPSPQPRPQQRVETPKLNLPNAVAVMVLGILSLLSACYMVGIVLGIVALALSSKGRQLYKENPNGYNGYGMLNAGFVCAILGIVLGGLFLLGFLVSGVGILGSGIWALL